MSTAAGGPFHCEVTEEAGADGRPVARVRCHGRLVAGSTEALRSAVQPLSQRVSRIAIDCGELEYLDSMGLGALVALKVSSMHPGAAAMELVNLSPRVKDLLRITKLTEYLARPDTINYGG